MLLMTLAFHVCTTVLFFVTIIQFLIMLLNDTPNVRLASFGRSMGSYLRQIVNYLTFATDEMPFPFVCNAASGPRRRIFEVRLV
jgi:hypothetical protein